jgi:hypothetical protein
VVGGLQEMAAEAIKVVNLELTVHQRYLKRMVQMAWYHISFYSMR